MMTEVLQYWWEQGKQTQTLEVILVKILSLVVTFASCTSIKNAFQENSLVFGYKLKKRCFDSVSGNVLYIYK